MLEGLNKMDQDELLGAARMVGIDPVREGLRDKEALRLRLLSWMAARLGVSGAWTAESVERTALEWLAAQTDHPFDSSTPTSELEHGLWSHITEEAARQLLPVWRIASSMASLGPPSALSEEVQLLDRVAERVFPSGKARDEMRRGWEDYCSRSVMLASDLIGGLKDDLKEVAANPELVTPTLVLTLVVAMADAKYEAEESKLFLAVAQALGLEERVAEGVQEKVARTFWDTRRELNTEVLGEHKASLIAAHKTLEASGALRSLVTEVQSGFLEHLHQSLFKDPDFQRGLKAWNKAPYLWPVGFATGLLLYFRRRLHPAENRGLSALLYETYRLQQSN